MQYSLYLFTYSQESYRQYPQDSAEVLLRPLCVHQGESKPLLHIQSQGALRYYAQTRRIGGLAQDVLGVCIVTNGLDFTDLLALWQSFDNLIERLLQERLLVGLQATSGRLLWQRDAQLKPELYEAVERLAQQVFVDGMQSYREHRVGNSLAKQQHKAIALEEGNSRLLEAIDEYSHVEIYSQEGSGSRLAQFEETVGNLRQSKLELQRSYEQLPAKKKQTVKVGILTALFVIASLLAVMIYDTLVVTENNLADMYRTVSEQQASIDELNATNDSLVSEQARLNRRLDAVTYQRDSLDYVRASLQVQVDYLNEYISELKY